MHTKRFVFCAFLLLLLIPPGAGWSETGIPSSIKTIYLISHSHLDIGFTAPPETVATSTNIQIQNQVNFAASRPDYKWNVESTWQLDQFIKRRTPAQIAQLMQLVRDGRFGVGAAHSTMRSQKMGVEELNRLLWNAQNWRDQYGIRTETVFVNDVPSIQWAYPQVLAKSGVKYIVSGQNHFIGGGINQPYPSYLFWWEGPDGSRVLTWSAQHSYVEAFRNDPARPLGWGVPWGVGSINAEHLENALKRLTDLGYPYDAVMILYAFDNAASTNAYSAITQWNQQNDNPKFVMATPEDFFTYMLEKYEDQIPARRGNWISNWDYLSMTMPYSEKFAKNGQSLVPVAEAMWAVASNLGLGEYPYDTINEAWEHILVIDEHTGAGVHNGTQLAINQSIDQYWNYATTARDATAEALATGGDTLLSGVARADRDSIVVFNPVSWDRNDLVRAPVSPARLAEDFRLIDAETGEDVPYQKEVANSEILFVARDVPPVGFRRYLIEAGEPPAAPSSLAWGSNFVESSRYRVEFDANGFVASIHDKANSREIVNSAHTRRFNELLPATNQEGFFGVHHPMPYPTATDFSQGMDGPVAASMRVANTGYPLASAELVLYENLDHIFLINRIRTADLRVEPGYCAVAFPTTLNGAIGRVETAAGWWNPGDPTQLLAGSTRNAFGVQYALDLSQSDYGLTFAAPDVYIHAFGNLQTAQGIYPPVDPTIVSTFIRMTENDDERDADPELELRYAFRPRSGGFDAVRDARFGWEIGRPLQAREVPAASGGALEDDALSFFSVDRPNIVITSVKQADRGPGMIVKLQEIGGEDFTQVTLRSDLFDFHMVTLTTPLEVDLDIVSRSLIQQGPIPREVSVNMRTAEIVSLRIETEFRANSDPEAWMQY